MRFASRLRPAAAPLLIAAGVSVATAGFAQAQDAPSADDTSANLGEITVTGTRGRPRSITSSPAPIDVLQPEVLETVGRSGLQEALNAVLPSYNLPAMSGSGSGGVVRAAGLRGLQADQVLILVNGKRRHNSALLQSGSWTSSGATPVDLDLIPPSAISRIEVLRDGAAAQYGSDAISGVINVILKDQAEGGLLQGTYGVNYEGDGETIQFNAAKGFALPNEGSLFVAVDYRDQDNYTRSLPANRLGFNDAGQSVVLANEVINFGYGNPKSEALTGSFNATLPLSDTLEAYAFGTASHKEGWKHGNHRQATASGNIVEIYPQGASARAGLKQDDYQITGGLKGVVAGWDADLSTSFAHDDVSQYSLDNLNPTLGPDSPTDFYLGAQVFTQVTTNLDVTRGFDVGMAEPMQVSWGLEHRYEEWKLLTGEPLSYADGGYVYTSGPFAGQEPSRTTGVRGVSPDDAGAADRNVVAAYVDLAVQPTKEWYAALAVRHERYDDSAGDTTNFKLTSRYDFTPNFAVRGTVSTGFRAPSIAQTVYQQSTASAFQATTEGFVQYYYKVLQPGSEIAAQLGSEPLTPEKSLNYSLGFSWQPFTNASLTVDAYQIDVDDRIVMSSAITGAAVVALLESYGLEDFNGASFYTNAVDTRTQGVDVIAEYRSDFGDWGRVRWGVAYNHNETEILNVNNVQSDAGATYDIYSHSSRGYLEYGNPRDKLILSADWTRGGWGTNLRATQYGSVIQPGTTVAADREFGAKWIVDLNVDYEFGSGLTWSVGANNLFDTYPDANGVVSNTGLGEYGYISPFGFGGGYAYTRLTYAF